MAVLKCKMCGGDLNVAENEKVVECEYCGSKQTVPDTNDEKKVNLYNRANRLRIACEFDKAAGIYEQMIAEFPEDADAYWGLCLCNYGIEYVDDPATAKKIPTCHRASFEKMRKDENYELALENADMNARIIYEDQAKEIDRIMGEILAISRDEEPYDVFICYKETDNVGSRTPDSVLAQDIYDALTSKGYRVFFSRITLEDKLGAQYEPYIFSALNSAKVMLVVGTDYEYMNAVWVKNEWSRFLKLIAKDKSKAIVPCYKDMDPYDMPDEFKGLQSQDCGKLGFMQDLMRGIAKLLGTEESSGAVQNSVFSDNAESKEGSNASIENLLKRIFIFLENGEWDKAYDFCEEVLNQDPSNSQAYVGELMAELEVHKKEDLSNYETPFDNNKNYQKAVQYGDIELPKYIESVNKRIEEFNETVANVVNSIEQEIQQKEKENENEVRNEINVLQNEIDALQKKIFEITAMQSKSERINLKISSLIKQRNSLVSQFETSSIFAVNKRKQLEVRILCVDHELQDLRNVSKELLNKLKSYPDSNKLQKSIDEKQSIINQKKKSIINQKNTLDINDNKSIDSACLLSYNDALSIMSENAAIREYVIRNFSIGMYFAKPGDFITFGSYPQSFSENSRTWESSPITWYVLEKVDNKLLLISDAALDSQAYHYPDDDCNDDDELVTWENSTLKHWLNHDFLDNAFSVAEKRKILDISPDDSVNKVSLLQVKDVKKFFPTKEWREVTPTNYAINNGLERFYDEGYCAWWLRASDKSFPCIDFDGSIDTDFPYSVLGVCPVIWVNVAL